MILDTEQLFLVTQLDLETHRDHDYIEYIIDHEQDQSGGHDLRVAKTFLFDKFCTDYFGFLSRLDNLHMKIQRCHVASMHVLDKVLGCWFEIFYSRMRLVLCWLRTTVSSTAFAVLCFVSSVSRVVGNWNHFLAVSRNTFCSYSI